MFRLRQLNVHGFRGFTDQQQFGFDKPVTLLTGENQRGKSSTLNAVEWCLFGDKCIGKKTGIRERIDWEVANRYTQDTSVTVETEFEGPDGKYLITRELDNNGKRNAGSLVIMMPDGATLRDDEAEAQVYALFRTSFQDFMTTVYQHQESIRAILIQEPKERNDAIDRLLGLSEYRELARGMTESKIEKSLKDMSNSFEHFRTRAQERIRIYDKEVSEKRKKAIAEGVKEDDISEEQLLRHAEAIGKAVISLASELGISELQIDLPVNFEQLERFRDDAKDKIDFVWLKSPDVAKLAEFEQRKLQLTSLLKNYETAKQGETKAQTERDEFAKQHGDETKLVKTGKAKQQEIAKLDEEIAGLNSRANLVREAIQYLRNAAPEDTTTACPLCGADVPDLLVDLEGEWEKKIIASVGNLDQKRKNEQAQLEQMRSRLRELKELDKAVTEAHKRIERWVDEIASALQRELTEQDDPAALVNARLVEITTESDSKKTALQEKGEKRKEIFEELGKLRIIHDILSYKKKREIVERIWETSEFEHLQSAMDQASLFLEDVNVIKRCLAAESREEAEAKIEIAGASLARYCCRIANHPATRGLTIKVSEDPRTGLNSYAIESEDGSDPIPILSQGGFNCLALSLFFGLAEAAGGSQPFAFLMLDDPTQSLGPEMKRQLVAVLEDIAKDKDKELIISTPDAEFADLLRENITKSKAIYDFTDWTEGNGPKISRIL
ncbi:MAG: hypothetical protein FJ008_06805 [Chloroflexi bacterium]|nr:hypothetical protein [Chloroflexota bacterium]MBM3155031.1 hypothetical protein [Chloroflexota bacterium]MBM3175662.1 hypothetical protein [Chloroflexota bacterium]